jgi:hypothetical protein
MYRVQYVQLTKTCTSLCLCRQIIDMAENVIALPLRHGQRRADGDARNFSQSSRRSGRTAYSSDYYNHDGSH